VFVTNTLPGGKGPESLINVDFGSVTDFGGCKPQPQTDSFSDIFYETRANILLREKTQFLAKL